ncbi:unnamed protein product [Rhizophagus irregularis]|nr:unnamed protein product [Rhizophagus irregularis]
MSIQSLLARSRSNVFEFTSMMKKYSDHLETNSNMKRIHESKNPAREPSSDCNICLISKHVGEIDMRYSGLDYVDFLILIRIHMEIILELLTLYGEHLIHEEKCMLYRDLTGDASLANDQISKEIEERLRLMMLLEDPSIIIDLRTNNGFQVSKFDIFWNELDGYFNEHNDTVY